MAGGAAARAPLAEATNRHLDSQGAKVEGDTGMQVRPSP